MIRKLRIFIKMDIKTKIMVIRVYGLTGIYRFKMLYIPFAKLAKKIGQQGMETTEDYHQDKHSYIKKVRKVVMMTSKNTPWESLCLVQALTAQNLLNKKNISNTLYLGLAKDENNKPIAHAWIKHGGKVVVGEKGMERFSVVAKFGCAHEQV
jgi:hypothetical protein